MPAQKKERRRLTDQELDSVRQNLLQRKKILFEEIREDIEEDAREEYQDLLQSLRDSGDKALAELEEATIFSYVKLKVKLPALKGGASRKGKYLFQIASLNPALKGGACREANRSRKSKVSIKPSSELKRENMDDAGNAAAGSGRQGSWRCPMLFAAVLARKSLKK